MSETTNNELSVCELQERPFAPSSQRQFYLRELHNGKLSVGIMSLFPLSAEKLARFCTHCQILAMPFPLNALTGEEQRLGFFYQRQLLHECKLILPEPLNIEDSPILLQRAAFFQINQNYFKCKSIGAALAIIIKGCREFDKAIERRIGDEEW